MKPKKTCMRARARMCCALLSLAVGACGGGGNGLSPQSPIASIYLSQYKSGQGIGRAVQLTATPLDSMGNVLTGRAVTWTSSNTSVASVNSTGLVVALALGAANITATSEAQSGVATITVLAGLVLEAVSAGGRHTCGVTPSVVSIYCWGDNSSSQLGNGTTISSATPVPVSAGLTMGGVSAGGMHTCGLVGVDGAAYCWGDNRFGQLGDGTNMNRSVPVPVLGDLRFSSLSAGTGHTCGITFTTGVYCWGNNRSGQLGNGTTTNSAVPVLVAGAGLTSHVSAGGNHTCSDFVLSRLNLGQVYCWGDNTSGQLGNGTTTNSSLPVAPLITNNVSQISAGSNYTCATKFTSETFCWGDNSSGQLGNGTTISSATPVAVAGGLGFANFLSSAGAMHMCGIILGTNMPSCWGDNRFGEIGDGTTTNRAQPAAVMGGLNINADTAGLSAGGGHTCMVARGPPSGFAVGAVYCWGDNRSGQLGNGTTTNSPLPVVAVHAP